MSMIVRYLVPNVFTFFRILLTPIFVYLVLNVRASGILALLVFTVAVVTDYIDGYFARKLQARSSFGAFLDPLADKILVLATFVAFFFCNIIELWMVIAIVLRDVFITLFRIICVRNGVHFVTSRLAKWKTTFQFISIYVILVYLVALREPAIDGSRLFVNWMRSFLVIPVLMHIVVFITIYTGCIYIIKNYTLLKRS